MLAQHAKTSSFLEAGPVVDGMAKLLLAAQITLRGLNRSVPKQKLDLLQLPARDVAQSGAGTPQVMRGKVLNPGAQGRGLHDVPNCLGRNPLAPNLAKPVYAPEDSARADSGSLCPFVDCSLCPSGNWNRANVLPLADQVGNNAVFLSILQVLGPQAGHLGRPLRPV